MLRSMTGYGRGEASNGHVTVVVELRSVNNRFRDLQVRCPREYMPLEPRINNVLKDPFTRGRIDAFIRRSIVGPGSVVVADRGLAEEYMRVINELGEAMVGFLQREVPLNFILGQPGVLTVTEAPVDVMSEWPVCETAMQAAITDLVQMREVEGEALTRDLEQNLASLIEALAEVEAATQGINERIRQRLEARMRRIIGERFDPHRIMQEAALLADKSDISEETTRLRSHCEQFADALHGADAIGRRLDFLLQEMHREVNTIGSKAAEHPISHRVVDMKTVLERMREQSANVE
jgi:uncharacterized protein (TIGR00255 family)